MDFGIELASEHQNRATSYIIARNNLIYHCNTAGVSLGGYAPERGRTDHSTVVNNTLYNNDTAAQDPVSFKCNGTWGTIVLKTTLCTRGHVAFSR